MIYVARHGQTNIMWTQICGHADIEADGRRLCSMQSELAQLVSDLEQPPPITKIYVSPLRRAQETAESLMKKVSVPIEVEPRLIEMDFGQYDGLPIETPPEFQKVRVGILATITRRRIHHGCCRSGVSVAVAELEQSDEDVLLVCHNALIRVIDNYFHGKTMIDFLKFNVDNTQLLRYERKTILINDIYIKKAIHLRWIAFFL